jgi:cell division protein ZapA (FtsZ GTPase activity inhibitor)
MQAQTPTLPTPSEPVAIVQTAEGVPQTIGAVRALRAQRTELSNQLQSAQRRRDNIVESLREASASERPGLEARLAVLDERILELEQEIARTGELMVQAPGNLLEISTTQGPFGGVTSRSMDTTAIAVVFTLFVLFPIAIAVARLLWKRASTPPAPRLDAEMHERMRRLEAAVDTVAIEVERISEGQRFVTKLLAERDQQKLPR